MVEFTYTEEACSQSSQLGGEDLQKVKVLGVYTEKYEKANVVGMNKFEKWYERWRIVCDLVA